MEYKLTNLDIDIEYSNSNKKFLISKKDILSALAYWIVRQSPYNNPEVSPALGAFDQRLSDYVFMEEDSFREFSYDELRNLINEHVFASIPEIRIFNDAKIKTDAPFLCVDAYHTINPDYDFIDLTALARNVFFTILREIITQPLYNN